MSFGHALYYPHIHLTNKNWLKHAFLFWDKISRIVPRSVIPSDNEDVVRIRYETGFIEDYCPNDMVISDTFRSFSAFLERFLRSDDLYRHFRGHFHFDRLHPEYEHRRRFREDLNFRRNLLRATTQSHGIRAIPGTPYLIFMNSRIRYGVPGIVSPELITSPCLLPRIARWLRSPHFM